MAAVNKGLIFGRAEAAIREEPMIGGLALARELKLPLKTISGACRVRKTSITDMKRKRVNELLSAERAFKFHAERMDVYDRESPAETLDNAYKKGKSQAMRMATLEDLAAEVIGRVATRDPAPTETVSVFAAAMPHLNREELMFLWLSTVRAFVALPRETAVGSSHGHAEDRSNAYTRISRKKQGDALLKKYEAYFLPPTTGGYGSSGHPDRVGILNSFGFGVEYKAEKGKLTGLQVLRLREIYRAGGVAICVGPDDIDVLAEVLENLSNGLVGPARFTAWAHTSHNWIKG